MRRTSSRLSPGDPTAGNRYGPWEGASEAGRFGLTVSIFRLDSRSVNHVDVNALLIESPRTLFYASLARSHDA
jgi:hypothetical protein